MSDQDPKGTHPEIHPATPSDRAEVVALWRACGLVVPHNPPEADFDFALGKESSDILVACHGDAIIGTVMVGHDGHRGWMYYLAADPGRRHQGIGAALVTAAENWLRRRGVRKIQLMVRDTNQGVLDFYRRIGYDASPVTVMQRWLAPGDRQPD